MIAFSLPSTTYLYIFYSFKYVPFRNRPLKYLLLSYNYRCCYRNKCCTPSVVDISRGKMSVTNCGRICWSQEAKQVNKDGCISCCIQCLCRCFDVCKANTVYDVKTVTRIYNTSYVRQVSQYYWSWVILQC